MKNRAAWLVVIVGLAVLIGGCRPRYQAVDPVAVAPEPPVTAGMTHRLPLKPADIVLLIDQSGSMSGGPGFPATDPEGWRAEASRYLVSNLAAKSAPGSVPRVGVVHFGTEAPAQHLIPLTPLQSEADAARLNADLKAMNLGWTDFLAAFRRAASLFEQAGTFREDRRAAVVVFTDGEPMDARRLAAEVYFREIEQLLQAVFPSGKVDLFIVGIDAADKSWSRHRETWERLLPTPLSAVFDLTSMRELSKVYNDIIRVLYEIPDVSPEVVLEARELEFDLPAYLEWVEFHVFPESPELRLSIVRPDGNLVRAADRDVTLHDYGSFSIVVVAAPDRGGGSTT